MADKEKTRLGVEGGAPHSPRDSNDPDAHAPAGAATNSGDQTPGGGTKDGRTALHEAASRGNVALVESLCAGGADVDAPTTGAKLTPLHVASIRGHAEVARVLCDAGADLEREDAEGMAPLHQCTAGDKLAVVTTLLERGAEVDHLLGLRGRTALHVAAERGRAACAVALCEGGAEIDRRDGDGMTALRIAAFFGKAGVASALLENGADKHVSGADGRTPLHEAAMRGHGGIVGVLCAAGAEVERLDADRMTPLHYSMFFRDTSASVAALLKCGADVNRSCGLTKRTAMHIAAKLGHAEHAATLCAAGADVDRLDVSGLTALHLAAMHSHSAVATALIANGAAMNCAGPMGNTALHEAATRGHAGLVRLLCVAGADIDQADNLGMAALHHAVENDESAVVRVLLEHGAGMNTPDSYQGRTPLCIAAGFGRVESIKILCGAGADPTIADAANGLSPLLTAMAGFHPDAVTALCDCGVDPNVSGWSNPVATPLMLSAFLGRDDLARALLQGGARIDGPGVLGVTALHLAADLNHIPVVEELIRAGANTRARSTNSRYLSTPLHVACRRTRLECVLALLSGGADETLDAEMPPRPPRRPGRRRPPNGIGDPVVAAAGAVEAAATAIDVVGFGCFGRDEDPEQRESDESEDSFAARRDPIAIARIREALSQATRDRLWGRRGWLVVLRARFRNGKRNDDGRRCCCGFSSYRCWRDAVGEGSGVSAAMVVPTGGGGARGERRQDGERERRRCCDEEEPLPEKGKRKAERRVNGHESNDKLRRTGPVVVEKRQPGGGVALGRGRKDGARDRVASRAGVPSVASSPGGDGGDGRVASASGGAGGVRDGCDRETTQGVELRSLMEGLMELAGIEEGAFRHVVCYL